MICNACNFLLVIDFFFNFVTLSTYNKLLGAIICISQVSFRYFSFCFNLCMLINISKYVSKRLLVAMFTPFS